MNFLATLSSSWSSCFSLIKPAQMRQLLGAAFLMMRDSYRVLAIQSWWIIPLILGVFFVTKLTIVPFAILLFIVACSARSSVDAKDFGYFVKKIPLFLLYLAGLAVIYFAEQWLRPFFIKLFWKSGLLPGLTSGAMMVVLQIILLNISILLLIMLFFLLDTGMWARPIRNVPFNGIKMFFYNYPLFFLVGCVAALVQLLSLALMVVGVHAFDWLGIPLLKLDPLYFFALIIVPVSLLFMPFCTSLVHTFYIRRAYDHSELYTYL